MLASNLNRTAYEVLGISSGAPQDDIAKAHRTLMRKLHPDLNPTADVNEAKIVNEAFDKVKNAAARDAYDATLRNASVTNTMAASAAAAEPYVPAGDVFDFADTKRRRRKK